jgi:hypothetical protein
MLSLTAGPRAILDGKEFNKFFPLSLLENSTVVIKRDGSVEDAVAIMADIAEKYKGDTVQLANYLRGDTIEKTCQNIWNFIFTYIQYQEDQDGIEQIRRPIRSWADRKSGVDCDCMSVFISSILKNLAIDHYFRITKYDKPEFQHVYVIVPKSGNIAGIKNYFTIDGVIGAFNREKSYSEKKDFNTMSGIPIQFLNGIGAADTNQTILQYLIETRNSIEANPALVKDKICPCDAIPMFDLLISSWNDLKKRTWALKKLAAIENEYFAKLKFFQVLNQYMIGQSTNEMVMKESYLTGLGTLGSIYKIGPNADGTFYVYNDQTGETIHDYLTEAAATSAAEYDNANTGSHDGSGSGGSDGGSGANWWTNWGSGISNFTGSLINSFLLWDTTNKNNDTIPKPDDKKNLPVKPPLSAGLDIVPILITVGVVGGLGLLIWSAKNGKKPAISNPAEKAPAKKTAQKSK